MRRMGLFAGAAFLLIGLAVAGLELFGRMVVGPMDPMNWSVDNTFRQIFQQPKPPGVGNLRRMGMGGPGGWNLWMRFDADPETIRRLISQSPRLKREPDGINELNWDERMRPPRPTFGMGEALRIRKPEVYNLPGNCMTEPSGQIIVDRERQQVYVVAVAC